MVSNIDYWQYKMPILHDVYRILFHPQVILLQPHKMNEIHVNDEIMPFEEYNNDPYIRTVAG